MSLRGRQFGQSSQVRPENGDSGRRDAGDTESLAERVGTDLRKAMHDLTGEAGHSMKWKIARNTPPFVAARALDLALLAAQVSGVLDGSLGACDVDCRARWRVLKGR